MISDHEHKYGINDLKRFFFLGGKGGGGGLEIIRCMYLCWVQQFLQDLFYGR